MAARCRLCRDLAVLGFHPLDGAGFLRERGFPERIEFTDEQTLVRDLVWFADMTVGPDGQRLTFPARMAEVQQRYAPDHCVVRAFAVNWPQRATAIERAHAWIGDADLSQPVDGAITTYGTRMRPGWSMTACRRTWCNG